MDHRRTIAAAFACAVVILLVVVHQQFSPAVKSTMLAVSEELIQKNSGKLWRTPFTTGELLYVVNGEGVDRVSSDDPRYLDFIRSQIAHPVQNRKQSLPKSTSNDFAQLVDRRLKGKTNGFFVDCGANDGQFLSNTVYLETERQWRGLLVEANRRLAKQLMKLNRQAYVFGGCLSPVNHSTTLTFKSAGGQGGLRDFLGVLDSHITQFKTFESLNHVYCVPLGDLLKAIDINHVDFLSLDVQGAELEILKTVDFRAIRIDVIIAEAFTPESVVKLTKFFNETGIYRVVGLISSMDLMIERLDLPKLTS